MVTYLPSSDTLQVRAQVHDLSTTKNPCIDCKDFTYFLSFGISHVIENKKKYFTVNNICIYIYKYICIYVYMYICIYVYILHIYIRYVLSSEIRARMKQKNTCCAPHSKNACRTRTHFYSRQRCAATASTMTQHATHHILLIHAMHHILSVSTTCPTGSTTRFATTASRSFQTRTSTRTTFY